MAKKKDIVKCRYNHCRHADREMKRDDAVADGSCYYHPDCYEEKHLIREIVDYYVENFDPNPIMGALRKIVNTIVIERREDPKKLLFGLKYYKANNLPVRHPPGLYYVMKDNRVDDAWAKANQPKIKPVDVEINEELTKVDGYESQGTTGGFGRIFGR